MIDFFIYLAIALVAWFASRKSTLVDVDRKLLMRDNKMRKTNENSRIEFKLFLSQLLNVFLVLCLVIAVQRLPI